MKTYNNELIVYKGETFTIDKYLVNKDGSPFIISSKLENPYFLLTVGSDLYKPEYVYNKWLEIVGPMSQRNGVQKIARFDSTVPVEIQLDKDGQWPSFLPKGTTSTSAVYYIVNDDGSKTYKYATIDNLPTENGVNVASWTDYNCRLSTIFTHDITKDWNEQNYYWGIRLVDGPLNPEGSEKPISIFNTVQPILEPTKLTVLSPIDNIWR